MSSPIAVAPLLSGGMVRNRVSEILGKPGLSRNVVMPSAVLHWPHCP
jgi:hypothetical protein